MAEEIELKFGIGVDFDQGQDIGHFYLTRTWEKPMAEVIVSL